MSLSGTALHALMRVVLYALLTVCIAKLDPQERSGVFSENEFPEAAPYWGRLKKDPREGRAFDRLFEIYREREAIDRLLFVDENPDPPSLAPRYFVSGLTHFALGHFEEARSAFERAIECDESIGSFHERLSESCMRLGFLDDAHSALERAFELEKFLGDRLTLARRLAEIERETGDGDTSLNRWKKLWSEFDDDLEAWEEIAHEIESSGALDEALFAWRLLQSTTHKSVRQHYRYLDHIIDLELRLGHIEEALIAMGEALTLVADESPQAESLRRKMDLELDTNEEKGMLCAAYRKRLLGDPHALKTLCALALKVCELEGKLAGLAVLEEGPSSEETTCLRLEWMVGLDGAIEFAEERSREFPQSRMVNRLAGWTLFAMGRIEDALEVWDRHLKAVDDGSEYADYWEWIHDRGKRLRLDDDSLRRVDHYLHQAVELGPGNDRSIERLAGALKERGLDEETTHLLYRIAGDGDDAKAWFNRAHALERFGYSQEALESVQRASLLDPHDEEIYLTRLRLLLELGEARRGISEFPKWDLSSFSKGALLRVHEMHCRLITSAKMEKRFLKDVDSRRQRGGSNCLDLWVGAKIAESLGEPEDAVLWMGEACHQSNDPSLHFYYAELLDRTNRSNEAIAVLRRLIEFGNANRAVYHGLVSIAFQSGDDLKALATIDEWQSSHSEDPRAPIELARYHSDNGDHEIALVVLKDAYSRFPNSPEIHFEIFKEWRRSDSVDEACQWASASFRNSDVAETRYRLGKALVEWVLEGASERWLYKILPDLRFELNKDPSNEWSGILVDASVVLGDIAEARRLLEGLEDSDDHLRRRSTLSSQLGDWSSAVQELTEATRINSRAGDEVTLSRWREEESRANAQFRSFEIAFEESNEVVAALDIGLLRKDPCLFHTVSHRLLEKYPRDLSLIFHHGVSALLIGYWDRALLDFARLLNAHVETTEGAHAPATSDDIVGSFDAFRSVQSLRDALSNGSLTWAREKGSGDLENSSKRYLGDSMGFLSALRGRVGESRWRSSIGVIEDSELANEVEFWTSLLSGKDRLASEIIALQDKASTTSPAWVCEGILRLALTHPSTLTEEQLPEILAALESLAEKFSQGTELGRDLLDRVSELGRWGIADSLLSFVDGRWTKEERARWLLLYGKDATKELVDRCMDGLTLEPSEDVEFSRTRIDLVVRHGRDRDEAMLLRDMIRLVEEAGEDISWDGLQPLAFPGFSSLLTREDAHRILSGTKMLRRLDHLDPWIRSADEGARRHHGSIGERWVFVSAIIKWANNDSDGALRVLKSRAQRLSYVYSLPLARAYIELGEWEKSMDAILPVRSSPKGDLGRELILFDRAWIDEIVSDSNLELKPRVLSFLEWIEAKPTFVSFEDFFKNDFPLQDLLRGALRFRCLSKLAAALGSLEDSHANDASWVAFLGLCRLAEDRPWLAREWVTRWIDLSERSEGSSNQGLWLFESAQSASLESRTLIDLGLSVFRRCLIEGDDVALDRVMELWFVGLWEGLDDGGVLELLCREAMGVQEKKDRSGQNSRRSLSPFDPLLGSLIRCSDSLFARVIPPIVKTMSKSKYAEVSDASMRALLSRAQARFNSVEREELFIDILGMILPETLEVDHEIAKALSYFASVWDELLRLAPSDRSKSAAFMRVSTYEKHIRDLSILYTPILERLRNGDVGR